MVWEQGRRGLGIRDDGFRNTGWWVRDLGIRGEGFRNKGCEVKE